MIMNTSKIVWNEYKKYCNEPRRKSLFDRSDIPCLVKMSNGEIWSAYWVFDYDWHDKPFTGWKFRSMWGDYFIWDNENDSSEKVVAFAYM